MTQVDTPGVFTSQGAPSRFFGLSLLTTIDQFYSWRDSAYALLVQSIKNKGRDPTGYDIRPVSPLDDYGSLTGNSITNNFGGDWSIASGSISDTGASLSGTGNTILSGVMPNNRWMLTFGMELLTAMPAPEVAWRFKNGANTKAVFLVQDLFGWGGTSSSTQFPKAVATVIPTWSQSDQVTEIVYATAARTIYDVHYTLWAEPNGTTITSYSMRN